MKALTVAAVKNDGLACRVVEELAEGRFARTMSVRPRYLEKVGDGVWSGEIRYGPERMHSVEVKAVIVDRQADLRGVDWVVVSNNSCQGYFAVSPKRLANAMPRWFSPNGCRVIALSGGYGESRLESVVRQAANHLAAELTRKGLFRPDFLSFPEGTDGIHFDQVRDWVEKGEQIQVVSGVCLNADESRHGIVDDFADEIIDLLIRTSKAALEPLPVSRWYIYTFGPDDFEWLGDLGIAKVLLPYMWDAPKAKVIDDMKQNTELVRRLGERLDEALPFTVEVGQLSDRSEAVDIDWLVEASWQRAEIMLPVLEENPPAIFDQLDRQGRIDRVQQEAFLYLLDTVRWGQLPGEHRPPTLYVGLEVHGGYWVHGNLCRGPNGEFLPLAWLPGCVRQHWGKWVLQNRQLESERKRLSAILSCCGY